MSDPKNTALVVGGGLAGMQASLVLAERGHRVVLLDERPAIGGLFPLLDNQFPTQSCGVCFMACDTPTYCPFVQCELHENVEILPYTSVTSVDGKAGAFRVKALQRASCVDPDKCTDCGACEEVCPVEVAIGWPSSSVLWWKWLANASKSGTIIADTYDLPSPTTAAWAIKGLARSALSMAVAAILRPVDMTIRCCLCSVMYK